MTIVLALGLIAAPCPPAGADDQDGHGHHGAHADRRDAPAGMAVRLDVRPDDGGGYNLEILTEGFRFSPENTGRASDAAEGHAHLYVNGRKRARVYGPWFHLPPEWLQPGKNAIRVILNDNRHTEWSRDGSAIAAAVTLDGAAPDGAPFDGIEIAHTLGGPVRTFTVAQGAAVRLTLTAPRPVALHLHGYDIAANAAPGAPAVLTFRAEHAGRFALVVHKDDDLLGRAETAVAYVEVRPQ